MLRHIRMTARADSFRVPTKLFVALRDNLHALYPLSVPHRTPVLGEPDPICRCPYPIYTLCTPQPSPYDMATLPATAAPAVGTIAVGAAPEGTSEATQQAANGQANGESPQRDAAPCTTNGNGRSLIGSEHSHPCHRHGGKTRPALRVRRLWRGRASPEVYHPNIFPNRPTCYRCDICDGFQEIVEDEAASERGEVRATDVENTRQDGTIRGAVENTAAGDDAGTYTTPKECSIDSRRAEEQSESLVSHAARTEEGKEEADVDEEEEEAGTVSGADDDDFAGHPVSTDITNTIMPDTKVAELRYLDPFLVEVLGRPNTSVISRKLYKQFMAQLARCGVAVKDLAKRSKQLSRNAIYYSSVYDQWVCQQQQDKRKAARERRANSGHPEEPGKAASGVTPSHESASLRRSKYLKEKVELLDRASYTVRFAVAAYGLPYELGYFNSVADAVKTQAEPHRRYTCASSEEQMESMRRMLQGEVPNELMEFVSSRYAIAVGKPCYAIVLDHDARRVVLTFRGSLTMADAVVDISEGYAEVDLLQDGRQGVVGVEAGSARTSVALAKLSPIKQQRYGDWRLDGQQQGLQQGDATSDAEQRETLRTRIPLGFYEAVREAATSILPSLRTIHGQYSDYELFVTGHSLGAIEANVFHLLYCFPSNTSAVPFAKVQTYGFACAPLVEAHMAAALNGRLASEEKKTGSCLVNFSYGKDAVARLHVRDILQAMTEENSVDATQGGISRAFAAAAAAIATGTEGSVANVKQGGSGRRREQTPHSIATPSASASAIAATASIPDLSVLPHLTLAGTCFNIPHSLRRGIFAVPLDCPWRSQLIVSVESVYHHFPVHYARALSRLLCYYKKRLADTKRGHAPHHGR